MSNRYWVDVYGRKHMNHGEYQHSLKAASLQGLWYLIGDASNAIKASPHNHNCGYYADEINYARAEIGKRNQQQPSLLWIQQWSPMGNAYPFETGEGGWDGPPDWT